VNLFSLYIYIYIYNYFMHYKTSHHHQSVTDFLRSVERRDARVQVEEEMNLELSLAQCPGF